MRGTSFAVKRFWKITDCSISLSSVLRCTFTFALTGSSFGPWSAQAQTSGDAFVNALDARGTDSDSPPNIVLIYADDLGYGELGCYGQEKIRTPNIDALAAQGLRFTQFYAGSGVCALSRGVVMTGRDTGHGVIRNNSPWARAANPFGEGQEPLPEASVTLAEVLQGAGYATGCFGKWGLGGPGSEGAPERQGFDRFVGFHCQWRAHTFFPEHLWRTGPDVDGTVVGSFENGGAGFEKIEMDNDVAAHQRVDTDPVDATAWIGPDYAVDVYAEAALEFIETAAANETPFFIWYATAIPHVALQAPERVLNEYTDAFPETPYRGQNGYTPHPTPRAAYAAMITEFDRNVGRLVASLRTAGVLDHTLILITSDNGTTFNGGVDATFFDSVAGLRGLKASLFEGSLRVPLVAVWPGRTPENAITDHVASQVDLLATLSAAARLDSELLVERGQGESFLPTLCGEDQPARTQDLYWELGRQQALRHGDWKIVRIWPGRPRGGAAVDAVPQVMLFDLANDPYEAQDLAVSHPDQRDAMLARLEAARETPTVAGFRMPGLDDALE